MTETRSITSPMRRVILPIVVAVALVIATLLISGSGLIRIEDVTANRIIAGTYGTPDWRVQEMNPLLAQLLSLLYRLLPAVNWYGALLLALLAAAAATGISLGARKPGGFWPAVVIVGPVVVLMTYSMISTVVCALCAAAGALTLMDGIARRDKGRASAIWGAVLFAFAAMLSLQLAVLLGVCAVLCWLPGMLRQERSRGLLIGVLLLAVICAALFGYSALMYNTAELSAYRAEYASYESLQHSSLRDEYTRLMSEASTRAYAQGHSEDDGHDHSEDEATQSEASVGPNVFDSVGWSLNDASLFFTRYSSDARLTDPQTVRALDEQASHWNSTPSRLLPKLWETVKKPQFLMLMGLFILSALLVLVTSRKVGVVLLAALVAFGGHVAMLAHYYDTFAGIAPFYLFGIVVMLFALDGEKARAWYHRVIAAPVLRIVLGVLVLAVFVAGMGGLLYYTSNTPHMPENPPTISTRFLKEYIANENTLLLIGENPNERNKPDTLEAPGRGEDALLLAGSYDLYSPRKAALMAEYGVENPLPDSVGRDDIGYVLIGFTEPMMMRLAEAYDIYLKEPEKVFEYPEYAESVLHLSAYTQEELEQKTAEQEEEARQIAEFNEIVERVLSQQSETEDDGHDHEAEGEDDDHSQDTPALENE